MLAVVAAILLALNVWIAWGDTALELNTYTIDSRSTDVEVALQFGSEEVKIAPCYYVTGNHEARVNEYGELKAGMEAAGIVILEDARTEISLEGETITLIGVNDPSFQTDYLFGDAETVMNAKLTELHKDGDGYTILLSHRPERFYTYTDHDIDLILSGHAHGGQFRLPFVGGLVAPDQGFFPEYDARSIHRRKHEYDREQRHWQQDSSVPVQQSPRSNTD